MLAQSDTHQKKLFKKILKFFLKEDANKRRRPQFTKNKNLHKDF